MIIQDGERMTTRAITQAIVPFEIHLPQLIGLRSFESLIRPVLQRFRLIQVSMSPQNLSNRAGCRYLLITKFSQSDRELSPSPSRMPSSLAEDGLLHFRRRTSGRM